MHFRRTCHWSIRWALRFTSCWQNYGFVRFPKLNPLFSSVFPLITKQFIAIAISLGFSGQSSRLHHILTVLSQNAMCTNQFWESGCNWKHTDKDCCLRQGILRILTYTIRHVKTRTEINNTPFMRFLLKRELGMSKALYLYLISYIYICSPIWKGLELIISNFKIFDILITHFIDFPKCII